MNCTVLGIISIQVSDNSQSSLITMFFFTRYLVSIKKWLYSGLVDPIEETSIGVCLKSLSHSEDGVVKEEDQKRWQSHKKKGNVLSMNVQDIPIIPPHSNPHLIGIV